MDEGEEIPSFYLDHDGGFVGSGFNDGSGNEGGGLQAPRPPPPPPPDFPSGFNSGVGGGSDDGGGTPAIPDLEFGNEIIPKRKRGRPRKPPTPAVVTLGPKRPRGRPRKSPIPAVETPVPTAWTPQNTNEQKQNFVRQHSDLSKLKLPSRLGGFRTGEQLHDLLKKASLALVSGIKVAADANEMIELIAPKMSDAQKAINEFEKQWKETMDGLDSAREETFNIRI